MIWIYVPNGLGSCGTGGHAITDESPSAICRGVRREGRPAARTDALVWRDLQHVDSVPGINVTPDTSEVTLLPARY